jgi:hypothetical protein
MPMPGVAAAGHVVIVIIAATTLAACRAPGAIPGGSPDGGSPIAATATVTSGSTRLPVDIPDAFPVFPGAAALPPADPDVLARWLTDANGADVYDFYVDALPRAGFEIELLAPGGAAAVISFRPADGPLFDLAFTAKEGGTQIDLRVPGP